MNMTNTSSDYLRYKADNYNCICSSKQIKRGVCSPDCDHCRLLGIAREIELHSRDFNELKTHCDGLIYTLNQLAIEKFKHEADAMKYFEVLQALLEDMEENHYSKYAEIIREVIK